MENRASSPAKFSFVNIHTPENSRTPWKSAPWRHRRRQTHRFYTPCPAGRIPIGSQPCLQTSAGAGCRAGPIQSYRAGSNAAPGLASPRPARVKRPALHGGKPMAETGGIGGGCRVDNTLPTRLMSKKRRHEIRSFHDL
jgi:hypothetical protein